jgi:hypothetical protein
MKTPDFMKAVALLLIKVIKWAKRVYITGAVHEMKTEAPKAAAAQTTIK